VEEPQRHRHGDRRLRDSARQRVRGARPGRQGGAWAKSPGKSSSLPLTWGYCPPTARPTAPLQTRLQR
jgi:hypothetical protein